MTQKSKFKPNFGESESSLILIQMLKIKLRILITYWKPKEN